MVEIEQSEDEDDDDDWGDEEGDDGEGGGGRGGGAAASLLPSRATLKRKAAEAAAKEAQAAKRAKKALPTFLKGSVISGKGGGAGQERSDIDDDEDEDSSDEGAWFGFIWFARGMGPYGKDTCGSRRGGTSAYCEAEIAKNNPIFALIHQVLATSVTLAAFQKQRMALLLPQQ